MAEPGRYYVTAAFTLAVHIISCKAEKLKYEDNESLTHYKYYINEGIYNSCGPIFFGVNLFTHPLKVCG